MIELKQLLRSAAEIRIYQQTEGWDSESRLVNFFNESGFRLIFNVLKQQGFSCYTTRYEVDQLDATVKKGDHRFEIVMRGNNITYTRNDRIEDATTIPKTLEKFKVGSLHEAAEHLELWIADNKEQLDKVQPSPVRPMKFPSFWELVTEFAFGR